ncbi:Rv3235 family protein [Nocardioides sp.]|uniref:Rv3235 family protein n=1 Tax=Nocardioides sp. TaxID=35761 RepID=UPI0027333963|nr:Rv3235 family protein [Nocardioides sp.]MDP3892978.1 Rv3235 family protein [Nocardioides sp.]
MTAHHVPRDVTHLPGPVPVTAVQGTLALDLQPTLDPPEVVCPTAMPGTDVVTVPLPVRRDLERWSRTFAQAAVEIVGGDRPVSQLLRWTTPRVHADLDRRARLVARAGAHEPGLGRRRPPAGRPQVVSVHPSFVTERVAEVSIRVRSGARFRALAARFEIVAGRWQCTALEFA